MCILGAVLTDTFVAQQLTNYIWTGGNPYDEKELEPVARLFKALSIGLQNLETFYGGLNTAPASDPYYQRIFPFLHSYCDSSNHKVEFQYIDRLYDDKAVYLAETNDGHKLIIKFVQRYNSGAHRLLAGEGFAPELYYSSMDHDDMNTTGGLGMVVMDFVDGKNAYEEYRNKKLPATVYDQVKKAIGILHAGSFVFGDLRLPNIIITGGEKPMLVDFDWCGKGMIDRYPLGLNDSGSIAWHRGVKRNGIMSIDHDIFMLEQL